MGTGTEDIITKCHDYGLQTPEFHQEEDFRVVIWRNKSDNDPDVIQTDPDVIQTDPDVIQTDPDVSSNIIQILGLIKNNPKISRTELARQTKISERKARRFIDNLREKGILVREGGDNGKWIIVENNEYNKITSIT